MNAPVTASQLAPAELKVLALDQLTPSNTHVQQMRRKRFDPVKLGELAESIKKVGVLQPIVARPAEKAGEFEIVAGERRWLAARQAGLTKIAVNVTDLPDAMVLEVQLVENLQREGLHEMEEAEGYEELRKLRNITADQVAALIGKSRSYVFARIKLLALCPEARKAFYAGEIDSSKALLVARIGHHDTQRKALRDITDTADGHFGKEPMTYREAHQHILQTYMLKLKQAPFDPKNAALVAKAGACAPCPKRTGNQVDLFNDVKDPDVCTDPKCFDDKRQATYAVQVKALEAKGKKVIYGDAAKKIFPDWDADSDWSSMRTAGGFAQMDKPDYIGGRHQTPAQLLGKDYQPQVVQHPGTGKLIEFATPADIAKAVKEKEAARAKKAKSAPRTAGSSGQPATKGKPPEPTAEDLINGRLITLIHAKGRALLSNAGLRAVVSELVLVASDATNHEDSQTFEKLWDAPKDALSWGSRAKFAAWLDKLDGQQLGQLAVELVLLANFGNGDVTAAAGALLKSLGLDPAKEQKLLEAELKTKAEAATLVSLAPATKKASANGKKK